MASKHWDTEQTQAPKFCPHCPAYWHEGPCRKAHAYGACRCKGSSTRDDEAR